MVERAIAPFGPGWSHPQPWIDPFVPRWHAARPPRFDQHWESEMVTIDDVRAVAGRLPRSYEVLVGGRVKFRVGRIVYLSFSRDESVMGFAFPKEEREWLIGGSPHKFMHPSRSDMRYHWVLANLAALDRPEMRELVEDAWRMVVPKSVAAAYAGQTVSDESPTTQRRRVRPTRRPRPA